MIVRWFILFLSSSFLILANAFINPQTTLTSNEAFFSQRCERINKKVTLVHLYNEFNENKNKNRGSNNEEDEVVTNNNSRKEKEETDWMKEFTETSPIFQLFRSNKKRKIPPMIVDDAYLLFYDVFLILNLTVSISFWVVHRMSFNYIFIVGSITEASLMCILWVACGFLNGAFLNSAVDGNYAYDDERAGPKAAGLLGLNTFISAASLRVLYALFLAVTEHRKVGAIPGEDLIFLEIVFGLMLMSSWRAIHSSYTPRI
mmetsp:Transcript_42754/g.48585  ORF Transcript_42754/g.48585 Transcript_42754/m.48585 type:complete len:259 (-) Transcript_42754:114-890(-)